MPRLGNINQYEQKKAQQKADALPSAVPPVQESVVPQSQQLREGFQQMGQMDAQQPVLQKWDLDKMAESQRNNYVQSFNTWEDAEKAGDISQQEYANAMIQKMVAEGKNPGEYLNTLAWLGSSETPEQKAKRERREQLGEVFNNLGNLIGNAANLYYTTKGGQYIDLNSVNEKHRERMQRIKDKQEALKQRQDELLGRAKIADVKAKREEATAKAKAEADAKAKELEYKRDLALKQIEHAFKIGQIDAQTAANMKRDAAKATSDKDLEAFKQSNRIALKTTPSYGQDKVLTSITGADGNVYTRNSKLDNVEIRELAKYVEDWGPYTTIDEDGNEKVDYIGAIADAADSGLIPIDILEQKGFKKGKSSTKRGKDEGFSYGSKSEKGYSFK